MRPVQREYWDGHPPQIVDASSDRRRHRWNPDITDFDSRRWLPIFEIQLMCSYCSPLSLFPVDEVFPMMPLLTPTDVRGSSRLNRAMSATSSERERERQERQDLLEDNRRLAAENDRLAEENLALREAAAIWIRLYEKQLERANDAARPARSSKSMFGRSTR
jgi:hypothetical protein